MRVLGIVFAGALVLLSDAAWAQNQPGGGPRGRYDYLSLRLSGGYAEFKDLRNTGSKAGAVVQDNDSDITAASGIALGFDWRKWNVPIRTEIEYFHDFRFDYTRQLLTSSPNTGSENNIEADTVLVNVYYDIRLTDRWVPYIGGGIGYSNVRSETKFVDFNTGRTEDKTGKHDDFAWSIAVGTNYFFAERWSAQVGYRYTNLGGFNIGPLSDGTKLSADSFEKHELVLGVSWWF